MNRRRIAILLAAALSGCAAGTAAPGARVVPRTALALREVTGPDGAPIGLRAADVWGDARLGPHGTLAAFRAGLVEPLHTHSASFRAVVLKGPMRYEVAGVDSPPLDAGSYVAIPAGVPHRARCLGPDGCEVFFEQDGALDVRPAR